MGAFGRTDILFAYKAGGNLGEATYSRASAATYRDRTGTVSTASSTGVSRLEWYDVDGDGGWEQPALLLEGARTNTLLRSEDFSHAAWTKTNVTVTANQTTAPDASTTADLIRESTSTGVLEVRQNAGSSAENTRHAASVYAKQYSTGRPWLRFGVRDKGGTLSRTWFNLSTGGIGTQSTAHTAWQTKDRKGWWRCSVEYDSSSGTAALHARYGPVSSDNAGIHDGSTTEGMYVWGGQYEAGAFPTSYIPTSSASVSRAVDTLKFPRNFAVPDNITIYSKWKRPPHADITGTIAGNLSLVRIGGGGTPHIRVSLNLSSLRKVECALETLGATAFPNAAIPASTDPLEVTIQIRNLRTGPQARIDIGSGFAAWGEIVNPIHDWSDGFVWVGDRDGGNTADAGIIAIKIARGLHTLADMRTMRTEYGE